MGSQRTRERASECPELALWPTATSVKENGRKCHAPEKTVGTLVRGGTVGNVRLFSPGVVNPLYGSRNS